MTSASSISSKHSISEAGSPSSSRIRIPGGCVARSRARDLEPRRVVAAEAVADTDQGEPGPIARLRGVRPARSRGRAPSCRAASMSRSSWSRSRSIRCSASHCRSRNLRSSCRNAGSLGCALAVDEVLHGAHLRPVHVELQEVGRAADAGVVVADRLLALPLQPVVRELDPRADELEQVLLDPRLVLGGRAARSAPRRSSRPPRGGSGARASRAAPRSSRVPVEARGSGSTAGGSGGS